MMNYIDLSGQRFGKLTVLRRNFERKGNTYWDCKCDCGNETVVMGQNLKRGLTKSCGCYHNEDLAERRFVDITGKRYGKLVVLKRAENRGSQVFWLCQCDCGNKKEINATRLKSGKTKSCGCLKRESMGNPNFKRKVTHGKSNTRIYAIYKKMYRRCYCEKTKYYDNYGGRGITICQEWLDDFMNFYNWAMENGYRDDLSIDRIDNNGNYCPENCRWVDAKKQANNTRSTIFLTYKGETKSASEWSERIGIPRDSITYRKRKGWTDEECLETPLWGRMGKRKK